jgi:predicted ATP-grasp superfamily ATP-dependent carboligase
MSSSRRILVTDGDQRSALAAVRSLGRAGHRVWVASRRGASLAGASRHVTGDVAVGDPLEAPRRFAEAVGGAANRFEVQLLLPMTEGCIRALLANPASHPAHMPYGSLESFLRISDKEAVLSTARDLGLAVPEQRVLDEADPAFDASRAGLPFPLVVKPGRSVGAEKTGELRRSSVRHASSAEELESVLASLPESAYPVLLQRRVLGPGVGVFLLVWNGEVLARFAHRRLREKPPSGGVSVYRESIPADPDLVDQATALLRAFDWEGVAMVEFKVDASSGIPYLMEINPRFWGSLQLAIDAGVDFPALFVEAVLGSPRKQSGDYRVGVRSRWWWGDIDHLILRLRRPAEDLHLPPGAASRAAVVREFLRLWRPGDRSEVLRLGDPWPFMRESWQWLLRR